MYNLKCKYMKKNQEPDLILQIWQKKTWRMMRWVGLICLWCLLCVPKVGYAQTRLVSLDVKETPIKQVLRLLGSEYGKDFFYSNVQVDMNERVSVTLKDVTIGEAIKRSFEGKEVKI